MFFGATWSSLIGGYISIYLVYVVQMDPANIGPTFTLLAVPLLLGACSATAARRLHCRSALAVLLPLGACAASSVWRLCFGSRLALAVPQLLLGACHAAAARRLCCCCCCSMLAVLLPLGAPA